MSGFEAAVERAQSKAAILQSLQNSYNTVGSSSVNSFSENRKAPLEASKIDSAALIAKVVGDESGKGRQFFKENIRGKAIVLENLKSQLEASSSKRKLERAERRQKLVSNKKLKALGVINPAVVPCELELRVLQSSWWQYARNIVQQCTTEQQLQARLCSMEYVGAYVHVLDVWTGPVVNDGIDLRAFDDESQRSKGKGVSISRAQRRLKGLQGVITAVTQHCFFLTVDRPQAPTAPDAHASLPATSSSSSSNESNLLSNDNSKSTGCKKGNSDAGNQANTAIPLVRGEVILGFVLPQRASNINNVSNIPTSKSATNLSALKNEQPVPSSSSSVAGANAAAGAAFVEPTTGFKFNGYEGGIWPCPANKLTTSGGTTQELSDELMLSNTQVCILYGKKFLPFST